MTSNKYLLEIGVEEIPAKFIDKALEQLKNNTGDMLRENRIEYTDIYTYSTPRRLTVIVEGLAEKQSDLEEEVKGPAKRIAFAEDGSPSKALQGFLRSKGIEEKDIVIKEFNGEEYVFANIVKDGRETVQVLSEEIPNVIKSIVFPKSMRWGGKSIRFARPIRWIVSMLNDKIVPFDLEGIMVSNISKGHSSWEASI